MTLPRYILLEFPFTLVYKWREKPLYLFKKSWVAFISVGVGISLKQNNSDKTYKEKATGRRKKKEEQELESCVINI